MLSDGKRLLVDELTEGKDQYDANTVVGCINRIARMTQAETLAEKYNFNPELDAVSEKFRLLQEKDFWFNTEMKFAEDKDHYKHCPEALKRGLDLSLIFFAGGDGEVVTNIVFRFLLQSRCFAEMTSLIVQLHQELIHAENYITTIKTLVPPGKREKLLSAADKLDCVRDKEILMEKYMMADLPQAYCIIAFCCAEGISFWSVFSFIFWFRNKNMFPNVVFSNVQISIDESKHRDYGCARYRTLPSNEKISHEHVLRIISEFVEVEKRFADALMPEPYEDLSAEGIKSFVEYMADNLLIGLGYPKHWGSTKMPLKWMNVGSRSQKANFYECDVASYTNDVAAYDSAEESEESDDVDAVDF